MPLIRVSPARSYARLVDERRVGEVRHEMGERTIGRGEIAAGARARPRQLWYRVSAVTGAGAATGGVGAGRGGGEGSDTTSTTCVENLPAVLRLRCIWRDRCRHARGWAIHMSSASCV